MRQTRAVAWALAAVVVLVTAACYPPSQTPVDQPIPPGGRVVATGPILTEMWIADTDDDLSTILYARQPFDVDVEAQVPYRFWVYDDDTATTTEVPVGRAEFGTAALSPDGRSVVFSSNDPSLQVGPTAVNCARTYGPWRPDTFHMCGELYLFDLDTGETRQLTGLSGSSGYNHLAPTFTEDGTAIEFTATSGRDQAPTTDERRLLDLATGQVEEAPPAPQCCRWTRGTRAVEWDGASGTLTSQDTTTGEVTTLWTDDTGFSLVTDVDDGRFIVVSRWVTAQTQVFRLIDTATGAASAVPSQWLDLDASDVALVQLNVAPDATDRLILAPLQR